MPTTSPDTPALPPAPSPGVKARRPCIALLMSLVLPGFGQLYNGEVNKAIYLFLGFALLSVPGVALTANHLPSGAVMPAVVLGLLATLGLWLYGMADAWRGARARSAHVPQAWQLGGVYLLVFLLCDALALPLLIDHVRRHQVASYRIASASMAPGVLHGDVLFADMRYNCPGCASAVRRGDVAIFTYPNNRTQSYVKRVIALPGDRVQIQGREVRVNGQPLTTAEHSTPSGWLVTEGLDGRSWQVQWQHEAEASAPLDLQVPPGQAFVLGDNRDASQDTRQFGTVPLHDIVGRARQIWFSKVPGGGVRWERLGRVVE